MTSTSRSDSQALSQTIGILDTAASDAAAAAALDTRLLQDLLAAVTRLYAVKLESGESAPALSTGGAVALPTATEVLVTVSGLLESAHIEPFELGLWQASQGRPSGGAELG